MAILFVDDRMGYSRFGSGINKRRERDDKSGCESRRIAVTCYAKDAAMRVMTTFVIEPFVVISGRAGVTYFVPRVSKHGSVSASLDNVTLMPWSAQGNTL